MMLMRAGNQKKKKAINNKIRAITKIFVLDPLK